MCFQHICICIHLRYNAADCIDDRKEEAGSPALPEMIRLIASDIDGTLVPDGAPALNPE